MMRYVSIIILTLLLLPVTAAAESTDGVISRILDSIESRGKISEDEEWRRLPANELKLRMDRSSIHPAALSIVAEIIPNRYLDAIPGETADFLGRLILDADSSLRRGTSIVRLRSELLRRVETFGGNGDSERGAEFRESKVFNEKMNNRGRQSFSPANLPGLTTGQEEIPSEEIPDITSYGDGGEENPEDPYRPY